MTERISVRQSFHDVLLSAIRYVLECGHIALADEARIQALWEMVVWPPSLPLHLRRSPASSIPAYKPLPGATLAELALIATP